MQQLHFFLLTSIISTHLFSMEIAHDFGQRYSSFLVIHDRYENLSIQKKIIVLYQFFQIARHFEIPKLIATLETFPLYCFELMQNLYIPITQEDRVQFARNIFRSILHYSSDESLRNYCITHSTQLSEIIYHAPQETHVLIDKEIFPTTFLSNLFLSSTVDCESINMLFKAGFKIHDNALKIIFSPTKHTFANQLTCLDLLYHFMDNTCITNVLFSNLSEMEISLAIAFFEKYKIYPKQNQKEFLQKIESLKEKISFSFSPLKKAIRKNHINNFLLSTSNPKEKKPNLTQTLMLREISGFKAHLKPRNSPTSNNTNLYTIERKDAFLES